MSPKSYDSTPDDVAAIGFLIWSAELVVLLISTIIDATDGTSELVQFDWTWFCIVFWIGAVMHYVGNLLRFSRDLDEIFRRSRFDEYGFPRE